VLTRVLGPSGNVELLVDNIHVLGGADDTRRLRSLIPTSLLCVGAGGAMGPEAPLVQTTGTLGTWVARRTGRAPSDVRVLTITGMAAGFTVLFGAPLGAALFALEILHRRGLQYYEALLPAIVGSLCGYGVYIALSGAGIEEPRGDPKTVYDTCKEGFRLHTGIQGCVNVGEEEPVTAQTPLFIPEDGAIRSVAFVE
jgi:H+/Cl- antiporter ClcA